MAKATGKAPVRAEQTSGEQAEAPEDFDLDPAESEDDIALDDDKIG